MTNQVTNTQNKVIVTATRGPGIQQFLYQVQVFTVPGGLSVGQGKAKLVFPGAVTLSKIRASVGTAPLGSEITIDVNKNGTTVFTNQANRPKIYAGESTVTAIPAVTIISPEDYLTIDIDSVGSVFGGENLTVQIEVTP